MTSSLSALLVSFGLLVGASGYASAAEPARWCASTRLTKQINSVTRTQAYDGQRVKLLVNGVASFAKRRANIKDADVVFMKTYSFANDQTGRAMADLLKQKVRDGKRVFLQVDVKGTVGSFTKLVRMAFSKPALPPLIQEMADAGVTVIPSGQPTLLNPFSRRDHSKYLLTWKQGSPVHVIEGGLNVADGFAFGGSRMRVPALNGAYGFRDTDIELTGRSTQQVMNSFIDSAAGNLKHKRTEGFKQALGAMKDIRADDRAFEAPGGTARVRFVTNRPWEKRHSARIQGMVESLMKKTPAGEPISISVAYFLPTPKLTSTMISAAKRGVKFRLLVNGADSVDPDAHALAWADRDFYRELLKKVPPGSVRIYQWGGDAKRGVSAMHQKVASFGEHGPMMIGSSNLDAQSLEHNMESVALIEDAKVRQQFDKTIERDFAAKSVHEITAESLARENIFAKLGERALRHLFGNRL